MSGTDARIANTVLTRRRLLALSATAMAVAASGAPDSAGAAAGGSLQYGEGGAFSTFNPWAQVLTQLSTANQMFSRLVYKGIDGQPVGDAAESWQLAGDGLSIRLKLRPGVRWHDGKALVAQDFVDMYGYLSDPALESDQGVQKIKALFAPVTAVKAPDPATVELAFSAPVPYALDLLNFFYAVRFDDPADTSFVRHLPIGTGPFKMTEYVQGQNASFTAFPDYHVAGRPALESFRFHVFAQGSNLVPSLLSGQVGGILVNNHSEVESLRSNPAYRIEQVPLGVWLLMVNVSKPPFDNVAVRQALSYSMNRQAFSEAVHFGFEKAVTSPFFAEAATGYVPDLVQAHAFDLDKARSLLEGAGATGLTIAYPAPSTYPNLGAYGEIWQADLAKIGVTLNIQTVDAGRWYDIGAGKDPRIDVVPWQVSRCLQDGAVFFAGNSGYRAGGTDHRFGYQNATLEQLVADGKAETDPARRKQIYQQLNQIVVDQCVNISFVTFSETFAWSSKISGPAYDLVGNLILAATEIQA